MPAASASPYSQCPVYETQSFRLRLVEPDDAEALLACYSDPAVRPLFNSDNCHHSFVCSTRADMRHIIDMWLSEYRQEHYVRFSLIDKSTGEAAGTLECFAWPQPIESVGKLGLLRLDLASRLETAEALRELVQLVDSRLFDLFGVNGMLTKAVPEATERIAVLTDEGYRPDSSGALPYPHYYLKLLPR
ncbi:GNAT family N-acetyltransferase [Gorillibacterium sp. sgz500922]|uniref:GNAT family N-acetyltransferase n=1 Tax=Gorillibacterium sp. sgz500922 TaxID=3446694 RepID=UPI003F6798F8